MRGVLIVCFFFFFILFFFQAEDGIRDRLVTGVQTCALPIFCNTAVVVTVPAEEEHLSATWRVFFAS